MTTSIIDHHPILSIALRFGLLFLAATLSTTFATSAANSSEPCVSDFSLTEPERIQTSDITEALAMQRATRIQPLEAPTIRLPVFFAFDSTTLLPDAEELLSKVGAALLSDELDEYDFSVEGHTDSVGPESYNARLSRERADVVKAFLVARGVPENRLGTLGHGEGRPVASNATGTGRQRNRRVELINRGAAR